MKNPKQKLKNVLLLVTVLITFSCSEELFENHLHHHDEDKNEISFKQFKNETGINKFDYLKKAGISKSTDFQARTIESEFITDTIGIKKYVNPANNKTTYSFKIYPLSEDLNAKEYYNLVYEKVGTEWNEIIFFNTEKNNPTDGRKLESSEMVYNRISGREGFSEVITYSVHCNGSCSGACDGFACPTGECIRTTITYIYTGIQDSGSGNNGIPTGTGNNNNGNSGGGSDEYSGIFIPNSYDGDVDLNNVDFIFAGQVVAYTSSLPSNLKAVMSNNFWLFYDIKEFFKNNGGLTRANKDAVEYALSNIQAIFTTLSQNSNDLTTVQINQTKQSAFVFLLQHGAWLSGQSATTQQSIKNYSIANSFSDESEEFIGEAINYCETNGNTPEVLEETNNTLSLLTNGTINGLPVDLGDSTPITNMANYLSCFNTTQGAVLTIAADQPDAGDHDLFTLNGGVGHSFITIKQGNKVRSLGFYPKSGAQSIVPNTISPNPNDFYNVPGEFHNNENTSYDVSLSVPITASQLSNLINGTVNFANNNPVYNLSSLNCTDIAIVMFETNTTVNLPSCESPNILWDGQTPGTLGEVLRDLPTPTGGTKDTNGGTSPQNNG